MKEKIDYAVVVVGGLSEASGFARQTVRMVRETASSEGVGVIAVDSHPNTVRSMVHSDISEDIAVVVFKRMLGGSIGWLLSSLRVAAWAVRTNPQTLHLRGHSAAAAGVIATIFIDVRLVFDMRGVVPEEGVALKKWRRQSLAFRLVKGLERLVLSWSSVVFVVSKRMSDHVKSIVPSATTKVIPNVISCERFDVPKADKRRLRSLLNLQDEILLTYVGGLQPWQSYEYMVQVVNALVTRETTRKVRFLTLTGSTTASEKIVSQYDALVKRSLVRSVEPSDIPAYLAVSDYGLLLRDESLISKVSCPGKFAEYLAGGCPVLISSHVGDLSELVAREGVGLVLDVGVPPPEVAASIDNYLDAHGCPNSTVISRCQEVATRFDVERWKHEWKKILNESATRFGSSESE